ncbi:hypothetical protein C8R44DRAFT_941551 [Mycena epipterygia]|nr:hypothetical protein C8R44DRAFT_941551 [Mycena epipterygia]
MIDTRVSCGQTRKGQRWHRSNGDQKESVQEKSVEGLDHTSGLVFLHSPSHVASMYISTFQNQVSNEVVVRDDSAAAENSQEEDYGEIFDEEDVMDDRDPYEDFGSGDVCTDESDELIIVNCNYGHCQDRYRRQRGSSARPRPPISVLCCEPMLVSDVVGTLDTDNSRCPDHATVPEGGAEYGIHSDRHYAIVEPEFTSEMEALLDGYVRDELMKRRKQERRDDGYDSNEYDDYSR